MKTLSSSNAQCRNTTYAQRIERWLNETQSDINGARAVANVMGVFQRQYYDMPRKPGVRCVLALF